MNLIAKIFRFFANPRLIIGVLGATAVGAVFRFGARYGIVDQTLLLVVIGLVIITLLLMLLVGKRERKGAEQIEHSLIMEADSAVDSAEAEQKQARAAARAELLAAINALKQSRLAGGRSGGAALYVLPWYLVLGRADAGKSTLIRNSGLQLPGRGPGEIKGIGSSRNCEWWFTNQAVILETHHRFADIERAQTSERDWATFLDLLGKHRPRRALNGVIVTISAEDLIHHGSERLDEQARLLRKRLDELIHRLRLVCPIYLVVTKADLLHGFGEFFQDLEGPARNQIWGATFSAEQAAQAPADKVFEQEFHQLYRALLKRRLPRLVREQQQAAKAGIYLFPLEFHTLRDRLQRVVKILAETDAYGYTPLLRGFYLTSGGGGEGTPMEVVLTEVSRVIGVGPGGRPVPSGRGGPAPGAAADGRRSVWPLFLKGFFFQVLIPDFALARPTAGAARKHRLLHLGLRVGVLAALGIAAWLIVAGFFSHRALIARTRDLALAAGEIRLPPQVTPKTAGAREVGVGLYQLDELRRELAETGRGSRLYCGGLGRLDRRAAEIHAARLAELLLAPSYERLGEQLLRRQPALGAGSAWLRDYQLYLELRDPSTITADDPTALKQRLDALWQGAGEASLPADLVGRHLDLAWRHREPWRLKMLNLTGPPDRQLEELALRFQHSLKDPYNLFPRLVEDVNRQTRPFTLDSAGAGSALIIDRSAASGGRAGAVPGAYTQEGWRNFRQRLEQPAQDPVLSTLSDLSPELLRALVEQYADICIREWNEFFHSVSLRDPTGVPEAARSLHGLAATEQSPLLGLLRASQEHLIHGRDVERNRALLEPAGRIEKAFASLHALCARSGDQELRGKLGALADWLRGLAESGERMPRLAAEFTRGVMSGGAEGGPFQDYQGYVTRHCGGFEGRGEPASNEALKALLLRPAQAALRASLGATAEHLDRTWRDRVCRAFAASLGDKFPFSADGRDATLSDFGDFFSPDGIVARFQKDELSPYLREDGESPREALGATLKIDPGVRAAVRKAAEIQKVFFAGGGSGPQLRFEFVANPTRGARMGDIKGSILEIDGRKLEHLQSSARSLQFSWPQQSDAPRAQVSLLPVSEGAKLPPALRSEGRWAVFRLLRDPAVKIQPRASNPLDCQVAVDFSDPQGVITVPYVLRVLDARANPFLPGFFDFRCQ